jgi:hypothetical protein
MIITAASTPIVMIAGLTRWAVADGRLAGGLDGLGVRP